MKAADWQRRRLILSNSWDNFTWKHDEIKEYQNSVGSLREYHQSSKACVNQLQRHFHFTSSHGNYTYLKTSLNLKNLI